MAIEKIDNPIDSANMVKKVMVTAMNGWGYNFYRKDNQLESDDRLIRTKISDYLGMVREQMRKFEMQYRAEFLPPPTREKTFPDRKAVAFVKKIKQVENKLEAVETLIRGATTPHDDQNWRRHRSASETLVKLAETDENLMVSVMAFYEGVERTEFNADSVMLVDSFLSEFERNFKSRQEFLRVQVFQENYKL